MLKLKLSKDSWSDSSASPIILCWADQLETDQLKVCEKYFPNLAARFEANKFSGGADQVAFLTHVDDAGKARPFIFVGLGEADEKKHENLEKLRRGISWGISQARKLTVEHLCLDLKESEDFGLNLSELVCQMTVCAKMADYTFDDYKSKAKTSWNCELALCVGQDDFNSAQAGFEKGLVIGESVNWTRHMADMPPNVATPVYVAGKAKDMAKEVGLESNVFGPEKAKELSMGGFLAVQAGSEFDGQFIELEYKSGKAGAKKIALVGKGVTFDTGGVSLKPANYMKGMKYDMSGAAAVMGAMRAIAQLKPDVDVVSVAPMVENMPGGGSCRQDDIIVHHNGMSTEIENTDAEGRLILADALSYVEDKHKPDLIIDLATLTGACVVALGHFFSGLMTNNDELASELVEHGKATGDWLWPMPMHPFYKKAIKSKVADQSNCGSPGYGAGTITAGKFLESFVKDTPWAHIDIAGTESSVPDSAYADKLSTGVGVRLLVDFVLAKGSGE